MGRRCADVIHDRRCQQVEEPSGGMLPVADNLPIELQIRGGLPAIVQRQLVERAGANALRCKAAPGFGGGLGLKLLRARRPALEERPAGIAQGPLDRHADPHPAVVVEIGIDDVGQRIGDRCVGAALLRQVGALACGSLPDAQTLGAKVGRNQQIRFLGKLTGLRFGDAR